VISNAIIPSSSSTLRKRISILPLAARLHLHKSDSPVSDGYFPYSSSALRRGLFLKQLETRLDSSPVRSPRFCGQRFLRRYALNSRIIRSSSSRGSRARACPSVSSPSNIKALIDGRRVSLSIGHGRTALPNLSASCSFRSCPAGPADKPRSREVQIFSLRVLDQSKLHGLALRRLSY